MIEKSDFKAGSGSMSAALAAFFVLVIMLVQKFMGIRYANEIKAQETVVEREIRHHRAFLNDMHIYQMIMICGCLFSLNFLMRLNRDHDQAKVQLKDAKLKD